MNDYCCQFTYDRARDGSVITAVGTERPFRAIAAQLGLTGQACPQAHHFERISESGQNCLQWGTTQSSSTISINSGFRTQQLAISHSVLDTIFFRRPLQMIMKMIARKKKMEMAWWTRARMDLEDEWTIYVAIRTRRMKKLIRWLSSFLFGFRNFSRSKCYVYDHLDHISFDFYVFIVHALYQHFIVISNC